MNALNTQAAGFHSRSRVFIVDASLVQLEGHNYEALMAISSVLRAGSEVHLVAPASAPVSSGWTDVWLVLPDLYSALIRGDQAPIAGSWRHPLRTFTRTLRRTSRLVRSQIQALRAWRRFIRLANVDRHDVLLFPHADRVVSRSWLWANARTQAPTILRFIGVLELGGGLTRNSGLRWREHLRQKSERLSWLRVASESPLGLPTPAGFRPAVYIPMPPSDSPVVPPPPLPSGPVDVQSPKLSIAGQGRTRVLGVLGSARPDKWFGLLSVIRSLKASGDDVKWSVVVQCATRSWGPDYDAALDELRRARNVRLLPGLLTTSDFHDELSKCDAMVLPYDASVYTARGSAILYRCADLGIPAIGPANTGFGWEITEFGLGLTYTSPDEVPELLGEIAKTDWTQSGRDFLHFRSEVWRSAVRFDDDVLPSTFDSSRPLDREL